MLISIVIESTLYDVPKVLRRDARSPCDGSQTPHSSPNMVYDCFARLAQHAHLPPCTARRRFHPLSTIQEIRRTLLARLISISAIVYLGLGIFVLRKVFLFGNPVPIHMLLFLSKALNLRSCVT